jgi:hypothetical protein
MNLDDIPERALIAILEKLSLRDIYKFINLSERVYEAYHKIDFFHIYNQIKHWPKEKQVRAWFDYYYFLPPQGSQRWLAGRGCGIGGSELSTIEGENPYSSMRELLARKLNLPEGKFDGSIATRWGHIFEPMLQIYIEYMLESRVYETGNIPGVIRNANGRRVQNYSPDGVVLTKKRDFKYLIDKTSQKYFERNVSNTKQFRDLPDELILLLEFKNPYMRLPNGEIKKYYVSQPKGGMCTIPITEAALFVDGVFRKCSIREFNLGPRYDTAFHCRKARRLTYQSAMACGFIGIYDCTKSFKKIEENIDEHDSSDEWALTEDGSEDNSSESESSEELSNELENDHSDLPHLNDEEKMQIGRQISSYAIKESRQKCSEYHGIKFNVTSLVPLAKMLWGFFQNVIETRKFCDYYVPIEDAVAVLEITFHRLFKYQMIRDFRKKQLTDKMIKKIEESDNVAHQILPELLKHFSSDEDENKYDLERLNYGTDFGLSDRNVGCTPNEFESLAEKIVNDRHDNGQLKMYNPEKFFFDVESPEAPKLIKSNNYIDYTLPSEESAQKWLYQNVSEYLNWCKEKDYRPVGIIPWKLFEVASMIMYKDPDYLEKTKHKIIKAMDIVDEIKEKCNPDDDEAKAQLLSKYYPRPRSTRTARAVPTKEQIRKREQVSKAMQDWAEECGDSSSEESD